jgi:hypothetical protein
MRAFAGHERLESHDIAVPTANPTPQGIGFGG